jgi:uncharacterized RDD family membrane protein YckC
MGSYAGFWRRTIAFVIDSVPVLGTYFWVVLPLFHMHDQVYTVQDNSYFGDAGDWNIGGSFHVDALNSSFVLCLLGGVLYGTVFELICGATIGKLLVHVRVRDQQGGLPGPIALLFRNIVKALSTPILPIFIIVLLSIRKRGLHDMIAGTVCVDR